MKLSRAWWLASDEYIVSEIEAVGLPAPDQICGIPIAECFQLAREGAVCIEWISEVGLLKFVIDNSTWHRFTFGAKSNWDQSRRLKKISLSFTGDESEASRNAQSVALKKGYASERKGGFVVFSQEIPLSN